MTRRSRPDPRIRLLALDLDGTVLGPALTIRPRVLHAVAEACDTGVIVVVATGRMYQSALPIARSLGLDTPLICNQGAYVREGSREDAAPGPLLYHRPMRASVARDVIVWTRARGLDPHLNTDDRLMMEIGDEGAADYERLLWVKAEFVPDHVKAVRRRPTKVLAVGPPGLAERVLEEAREEFLDRAQVTVSHPEYLEWTAPGVHKGRALAWLARRLRVPRRQVMAVGDQLNDLEMLAMAGHGVAMGDAPEAVRAAARYVTAPFERDGVAVAIDALVLGRGSLD